MSIKNKSVLIRMTEAEHNKLDEICKKLDRSYSYVMRQAYLKLIEEMEVKEGK